VKSRTRVMIAAIGGAALALAAAQGCSSPVAAPTANVDTIYATASLDGWVTKGGQAVTAGGGPYTGEYFLNSTVTARQFYSFDMSLPVTAHLLSARLELYQAAVNGTPYELLGGSVLLDHIAYGGALTASAYNLVALGNGAPITFSTNGNHAIKVAIVTAWVQDDINNSRTRTQFRLRFPQEYSDVPGLTNNVQFSDAELSCCAGVPPRLIVSWQ
jgi:hypothetical protein